MKHCSRALLLFLSASLPAIAQAQTTPPADGAGETPQRGIEDIVVTAQKRSENVQDIPLAITAVSGDVLQERQVTSVDQISSLAPSVNFGTYGGAARISVRGIGFDTINPGAEGRIAYHVDGVYISRPGAQFGTFFDVDRVEVLRGPQGTLYGRNATGGSINVVTNMPTSTPSGYANLTVGNYGRVSVEAALSGPLTEGVQARLAVISNNRDGYGTNEFTGHDIDDANQRGARGVLRLEPASNLRIDLSADFYKENDRAYATHYFGQYTTVPLLGTLFGGSTAANKKNINIDYDPQNRRELYGFSGVAELDLGGATLRSITAYRHSDYDFLLDLDQTDAELSIFTFFEKAHQFSEELQLSGEFGDSKWLLGGYYFKERIQGGSHIPLNRIIFGGPAGFLEGYKVDGVTNTEAMAVFGQLDLAVTDQLKFIVGARYGHEKIGITDEYQYDLVRDYVPGAPTVNLPGFPRSAKTSDNAFTPKFGIEFSPGEDVLLYGTVSKGYKSGGFNLGVNLPAFDPESIWAYEAGLKLTTADRRLRANLATFYYDYANLQVSKVINSTVLTENAAEAELYGAELEATVLPVDDLQFDGTFSYLHSKYKDFSSLDPGRPALGVLTLDGNRLIQAPKFTFNLGGQYTWRPSVGEITLRGEINYMSRIYFTAFNQNTVSQPGNTKFNAYLSFVDNDGHWNASLFIRNITDKQTIANALVNSATFGSSVTGSLAPPRTFGIRVGYSF